MEFVSRPVRPFFVGLLLILLTFATACGSGTSATGTQQGATSTKPDSGISQNTSQAGVTSTALLTPATGDAYHVTSFAQAQHLASFSLKMPTWIPPALKYDSVKLQNFGSLHVRDGTPTYSGPPNYATLYFTAKDRTNQGKYGVQINETTRDVKQRPFEIGGMGTPTPVIITGHRVNTMSRSTPPPLTVYTWTSSNVLFVVDAQIAGPLTKADVKHMIASLMK